MLPESGYLFNSGYIHAIAHSSDTTDRELHAMLAYLNSFTGDWWARRIVDRHVTAPVISNLPIPDWDTDQIEEVGKLGEELTARNEIDTLPGGRSVSRQPDVKEEDEATIRAKIEKLVADGFGLEKEQLETILEDFSDKACPSNQADEIRSQFEDE
jgi:hypothetical protein